MNLNITDGFKLGCGFLLAGASAFVFMLLAVSIGAFLAALAGVHVQLPGL